ncbi:hypothetical protein [Actinoplanes sp. HUAS TT8]|uniref:hypothetical protein n=1 Tax=Actinoplanes sp. HUAS TT8 TaxID=3447453 RepID=UPI003F523BF6
MTTPAPPTPPAGVGDLAVSAAEGTRSTARWLASALGAIPSLALLTALVRAPGEAGYDTLPLILGVAAAATGALVGVLGFARVLVPLSLENKDLAGMDISRVPGQPYQSADDLLADLGRRQAAMTTKEGEILLIEAKAQLAEGLRVAAESELTVAEQRSEAKPRDKLLTEAVRTARITAAERRTAAATAAADLASKQYSLAFSTEQVRRAEAIRRDIFLLRAADEVRERFLLARVLAAGSVVLVAGGVLLLAVAPQPKPKDTPPVLLTLTLNAAGQQALGCGLAAVNAIRIGGTDSAPMVQTVPVPGCPSKTLIFPVGTPAPLGSASPIPTPKAS